MQYILTINRSYIYCFIVCKSCIVRHIQIYKKCPTCGNLLPETEPLSALMYVKMMMMFIYVYSILRVMFYFLTSNLIIGVNLATI